MGGSIGREAVLGGGIARDDCIIIHSSGCTQFKIGIWLGSG